MNGKQTLTLEELHQHAKEKQRFRAYGNGSDFALNVKKYFPSLMKVIPIPIAIGLVASYMMIHFYGWREFFDQVLSWTIGITIVTIGIATILSKLSKDQA